MNLKRHIEVLCVILAISSCGKKSAEFDQSKIVYSFACISDCHVDGYDTPAGEKFRNALMQLRDKSAEQDTDGLDGIFIAGDLINNAYSDPANYTQMDAFRKIYEEVFDPVDVPMIYAPGNHDIYGQWTEETASQAKFLSERLGDKFFLNDLDDEARNTLECRHCQVGDYHVLCLVPNGREPVTYNSDVINWLDKTLAEVTGKDPERYVFVITHPMIYGTVYGSILGPDWYSGLCTDYWYTKELGAILSKYPQVITASGHLHFPINDPRSIWQGDFTSLGCGSVRYMAIEDGRYEDMRSNTVMNDCNDVSSGLLCQLDANGNMRITKMFFSQNTTFGEAWTISYPKKDKSHLLKYNHESMKLANTAPVLSELNIEQTEDTSGTATVEAVFSKGEDDMFVHHYVLTLKKDGNVIDTRRVLADYYRNAQPSEMKPTWRQSLGNLAEGNYELLLDAYDSWEASSNTLSAEFTIGSGN